MSQSWNTKELNGLGEERLGIIRQAAKACQGKDGMARLDVFLEYGERLSAGGELPPDEQKALLAAVAATLPDGERRQLEQMMGIMGFA